MKPTCHIGKPIRSFSDDVVRAIDLLLMQLSENHPRNSFTSKTLHQCWNSGHCYIFLAEDTTKTGFRRFVGMGVIFFTCVPSRWLGGIHDIIVDKKGYRGKGIGYRIMMILLRTAHEFANEQRSSVQLSLTSKPEREEANKMYQRLGFELRGQAVGKNGTNYYTKTVAPV